MGKRSAGLLVWRRVGGSVEVLLGHLGGPLWARRDEGAWTIPKGEYADDETPEQAARREFAEETSLPVPVGPLLDLGTVRQSGGKQVRAYAVEGDLDHTAVVSNTFALEWPPRSGRVQEFPELDRLEWLDLDLAAQKVVRGQRELLDRLRVTLEAHGHGTTADRGPRGRADC